MLKIKFLLLITSLFIIFQHMRNEEKIINIQYVNNVTGGVMFKFILTMKSLFHLFRKMYLITVSHLFQLLDQTSFKLETSKKKLILVK